MSGARVLVTGGSGFLGRYLARLLAESGDEVLATYFHDPPRVPLDGLLGVRFDRLDVRDPAAVRRIVEEFRPDSIYHYAGQAYVIPSWEAPAATFDVNLNGTLHVLEAVRHVRPRCAVAFAGSGTEYGEPEAVPTPEASPLLPTSPYAASKAAADLLGYQYFRSFGIPVFRYRIFGTTGVGKRGDVCNDFARQIAEKEGSEAPATLLVGDLDKRRDIQDVRDAVRAMRTVVERGEPGGAYNIGAGEAIDVRSILATLLRLARRSFTVTTDPARKRRVDEPVHLADIGRLQGLGWRRTIPFEESLRGILDDWRSRPAS